MAASSFLSPSKGPRKVIKLKKNPTETPVATETLAAPVATEAIEVIAAPVATEPSIAPVAIEAPVAAAPPDPIVPIAVDRSVRDPTKQAKIEATIKALPATKVYDKFINRIESGQYRIDRASLRKNRANLDKTHRSLTEKLVTGTSKQPKSNTEKATKINALLRIMDEETNVENDKPIASVKPKKTIIPTPLVPAPQPVIAPPIPYIEPVIDEEQIDTLPTPVDTILTTEELKVSDKTTEEELIRKIKECTESCKQLSKQLNVIRSNERFEYELAYGEGEVPTLITLLEKVVLNPIVTWKENIESLINIPNSLEGTNRLKGGDYFEAFFQLAFALKFIPEISHFIMKEGEKSISPVEFLYEKPVKNSGGAEHGIVDIHFATKGGSSDVSSTKYQCGEIVKEPDVFNIHYFISAKNYYKEKSSGSYDVDQISNQIKQLLPHIKNPHVCVACRNKDAFYKKLNRMKTERLKLSINRVFGIKEILDFFEIYRNNFFSNIDSLELDKIHAALPPREKELKLPLSLYFHQELIINAVYERYINSARIDSHYTCIGVLPRGGKSYIAGGIMKKFDLDKPKFNVLFISSAINETMSQFKDDLINKFSDFNDYNFINLREEPAGRGQIIGKSFTVKYASKDKLFVFVSRELITGSENQDEDLIDDSKVTINLQKVFKRLDPNLKFDLIFFDEAHKGGITDKTKEALKSVSKGTTPVILLTATYKKLLDSQRGHINEQDDLFIWDLDDVRTMRKLVRETPDTIERFYIGESGKKYDMFERYSEQKIKNILSRRIQLGESLESIATPYINFPEPFFISTTFTPEITAKLQSFHTSDPLIGFSMKKCFEMNPDERKILENPNEFHNWRKLFKNKSDISTLRAILTPRDKGSIEVDGKITSIFNPEDPKIENYKLLNRIFNIAARDTTSVNARPNEGTPFSILMFLPVGTGNSLVGHVSRAWASKLHQDRFWRENFVFLVLSSLHSKEDTKPLATAVAVPEPAAAVAVLEPVAVPEPVGVVAVPEGVSKLETLSEENEDLTNNSVMTGGSQLLCVNNGYCDIENVNGSDLKSRIQKIEREALRDGKGLVIITGKRATMGISLPCVDVVCLFDEDKEADEIIQKMYRALTDSPNKKYGFIIDLNPVRILKAQYEYKDIKNATRKTTNTVESVTTLMNDVAEAGLWDTDAWIVAEEDGKSGMMKQIRDDMLNKLKGSEFKKYEDAINTKVPDELNAILDMDMKREISRILSGVHISSVCAASKMIQDQSGVAPVAEKPESEADEEAVEVPESKKKAKSEAEIIQENMKKIPKFLKHIINMLILRDEKILSSYSTLEDLLDQYESDKLLMAEKPLDCGCNETNNLYLRVYCGIMNFIGSSDNTRIFLERVLPYLKHPRIFIFYKNYVESFMAAMDKIPTIQSGGKSESSQKRYNSILQVIDDHLIPDECAKKERGEVFTPPNLVREMLFGLRKSALEKGVNEIWGINKEGNFFDESESDRVGGLPLEVWKNPKSTFLDPANGIGNFPIIAYYMLDYHLRSKIKDDDERRKHIIENMLFMIEVDKGNVETSKGLFKKIHPKAKPNILCSSTLDLDKDNLLKSFNINEFDVVMGNPPFNSGHRHDEGKEKIWPYFIDKSKYKFPGGMHILKKEGSLLFVLPQTWRNKSNPILKTVKEYHLYMMKILVSQSFYNYPMDYIYVINKPYTGVTLKISNDTFLDEIDIRKVVLLSNGNDNILNKIFNKADNKLNVQGVSTFNIASKSGKQFMSEKKSSVYKYPIIRNLNAKGIEAAKNIVYSSKEHPFQNSLKVVLSNGGYMYPHIDNHMGTSQNVYFILRDNIESAKKTIRFLNSKLVQYIFESLKVGHYGGDNRDFSLLPDINSFDKLESNFTDKNLYTMFKLTENEIKEIEKLERKTKISIDNSSKFTRKNISREGGSMKPHRFTRRKSRN